MSIKDIILNEDKILNLLDVNEEEYLTERTIITLQKGHIRGIFVHGDGYTDTGFIHEPYFKISDSASFEKCRKRTRIQILQPLYKVHNGEIWTLHSNEIKELMELLQTKKSDGKTVWDDILADAVDLIQSMHNLTPEQVKEFLNLPIPNYYDLQYATKDKGKYKGKLKK